MGRRAPLGSAPPSAAARRASAAPEGSRWGARCRASAAVRVVTGDVVHESPRVPSLVGRPWFRTCVQNHGVRVSAAALGAFTRLADLDVPGLCDLGLGDGDGECPVRHLRIDLFGVDSLRAVAAGTRSSGAAGASAQDAFAFLSLISPVTTSSWPLASTLMSLLMTPGSSISRWKVRRTP